MVANFFLLLVALLINIAVTDVYECTAAQVQLIFRCPWLLFSPSALWDVYGNRRTRKSARPPSVGVCKPSRISNLYSYPKAKNLLVSQNTYTLYTYAVGAWWFVTALTWFPTNSMCSPNRKSFSMSSITIKCCRKRRHLQYNTDGRFHIHLSVFFFFL